MPVRPSARGAPSRAHGAPPRADSLEAFASDLRELRYEAGYPTLQAIARRAHVSKSVVSDALAGAKPPTANTVERLAVALGADPAPWVARLDALRASRLRSPGAATDEAVGSPGRWRPILIGLTVSVALLVTASGWMAQRTASGAPAMREVTEVLPLNGGSAHLSGCDEDGEVVSSAARADGAVRVELLRSPRCSAIWGRATISEKQVGELRMEVYPEGDRYGGLTQHSSVHEDGAVVTTLLVRFVKETAACGIATLIEPGGRRTALNPPLCLDGEE